ncbi:zinc-dependent alcohol dehydrogenase family protein [Yokenella regensburgei]|uniref:zinc-dependent alcohol dehydrogenase family protein n=1 Tax=Yokenella regensburgei TaxID=158877 RepID=UPI003F155071
MINTFLRYDSFGEPETTLQYISEAQGPLDADKLRVRMLLSPINASDLIPITGAYGHRIRPPQIAGYEGVGTVVDAPARYARLIGTRVLPLRGQGTWQRYIDCPAQLAVPVPDEIGDDMAARAYINPLAAILMQQRVSPAGKRVLVTAAGSECAQLLGQWALMSGAKTVTGVYRNAVHAARLAQRGIVPVDQTHIHDIASCATHTDIVYDAVGGELANSLLNHLPHTAHFVSYGLLSGRPFSMQNRRATLHWFHMRDSLRAMKAAQWHAEFEFLWSLLRQTTLSEVTRFPLAHWQAAIAYYQKAGRTTKPLLDFTAR